LRSQASPGFPRYVLWQPSMLRRFARDRSRDCVVMTEDQRQHPVVQALHRRRAERSQPGERRDRRRIALVIEGGGMRGVVSAGMAAAIEQLGLTDCFDEVHGASAGAFNAAFLLAGQAAYLTALYAHGFGDPRFASPWRVLRGGPLLDMDYVIDQVWRTQRPLRVQQILARGIELHCTATDVASGEPCDLTSLTDGEEIRCALRASTRLPWLAGPPVPFRGRRWLDATLAEAIPVGAAQRSASDLLVLQTRPHGVRHAPFSRPVAALTDRYLERINPALVELRRSRSERYDRLVEELAARAADPSSSPAVCVIRPPAGTPMITHLEHRADALAAAGAHGFRAAWMALEGEDPELLSVPRAYPRRTWPERSPSAGGARVVAGSPPGDGAPWVPERGP